jgi:glycerol-3-phosphate acyltransferase PlsY
LCGRNFGWISAFCGRIDGAIANLLAAGAGGEKIQADMHVVFFSVLLGYLLGSIPFGLLVARGCGIDIRRHGSGNIGATNVLRTLGKKWGFLVFALDALKGVAAVLLAERFLGMQVAASSEASNALALTPVQLGIISGLACVLGHNFPVWLKFKGGKGVATTAGVLIGLLPMAALMAFGAWLVVFYSTRYVSVASIVAAIVIPISVWLIEQQVNTLFWFSVAVAVLGIWRHRSNIQRLMAGTESRFEKKQK